MTKIRNILFASLAAAFLSSCGEQYKAKQLVSNFLDRSLAEKDFSIENCSKLDSTYYITDSVTVCMAFHLLYNRPCVGLHGVPYSARAFEPSNANAFD